MLDHCVAEYSKHPKDIHWSTPSFSREGYRRLYSIRRIVIALALETIDSERIHAGYSLPQITAPRADFRGEPSLTVSTNPARRI